MIRQLVGDCRVLLATLEPGSIQAVTTSPPYYGLRDYGTSPLVWGGDAEHTHEFGTLTLREFDRPQGPTGDRTSRTHTCHGVATDASCECGAWLGSLGLELTPELYIDHIVECFRHMRRVLRDDGVLWLNLGDSYAGSGNGADDYRERNKNRSLSLHPDKYVGQSTRSLQRAGPQEHTEGAGRVHGYKPKDLMMMPFRVAMALQADGWWLRSVIPWVKRNSMPESVADRPSTSVEYVFLLAKSARYFWDADAVRQKAEYGRRDWSDVDGNMAAVTGARARGATPTARAKATVSGSHPETGRSFRNSDLFFQSWQGLMLDEHDDPLAFIVNPKGFSEAHFATFPARLIEPMVKASTRPGDTILDPFSGAGTVGLVADRLGRNAVLCELKDDFADMARERIGGDAPLLAEVVME